MVDEENFCQNCNGFHSLITEWCKSLHLGPVQTPLYSWAEPNWLIKYGKRAASESIWYGRFSLVRQKR